ncbi:protein YgfX [Paraburkholderia bannensis]|uniref:protein YgfX n=1 Tax=Paraburkholderia bannensis TaxID=765414 RepID=UPI002ABD741B|nr:protein YgfX [Paraburkholderia bannensis]
MIASSDTAAVPAQQLAPAGRDSLSAARRVYAPRSPRIALRPSWVLQALLLAGISMASLAFYTTLAQWLGLWRALPPALALGAAGGLAFAAWRRAQPAFIEVGIDRLAAFSRSGSCLVDGRPIGAAQWGGALLSLVVEAGGRRRNLLIAADSLDAESFRLLAVAARSASGR